MISQNKINNLLLLIQTKSKKLKELISLIQIIINSSSQTLNLLRIKIILTTLPFMKIRYKKKVMDKLILNPQNFQEN